MSFVVVTKTYFQPEMKEKMIEVASKSIPVYKDQPGLESIAMHISHDETHMMSYFVWNKKEDHEKCMSVNDLDEWNEVWEKLISEGKIKFELDTYDIIS